MMVGFSGTTILNSPIYKKSKIFAITGIDKQSTFTVSAGMAFLAPFLINQCRLTTFRAQISND